MMVFTKVHVNIRVSSTKILTSSDDWTLVKTIKFKMKALL